MQESRSGFSCRLLFASLAIIALTGVAEAQDMPPILAPLAPEAMAPSPPLASPSAEAVISHPAIVHPAAPATKTHVVHADRPAKAHHAAKFAALIKRLAARPRPTIHHVALKQPEPPPLPPGTVVPDPSYYPPGSYERLVYGVPPRGLYGGWGGYRGRYPYYP